MKTLSRGDRAARIVATITMAAPVSGVVLTLVTSLTAVWLASDHLGTDSGCFRGKPDWHRPDLASIP
jgi:hypothetical protein